MAGLDQTAEIFVLLRIRFVVMPTRDMQRADAGLAPAICKIIQVDAGTIGTIEKCPEALATEGRIQAQVAQGLQQVGKPLVALLARRGGDPKGCSRASVHGSHYGGAVPALVGKHGSVLGNVEDRNF